MNDYSFPITLSVTPLGESKSLPDTPWVKLRDLQRYLIGAGLLPIEFVEWQGQKVMSGKAFGEIDRWVTDCGFAAVTFMGRPVVAHTEDVLGEFQQIPLVYFRKLRGVYSEAISRVSTEQNENEMLEASAQDKSGFGDPDWDEVIVNRSELLKYITAQGVHVHAATSGGAGRPSSMYLIESEMVKRASAGALLPTISEEAAHLASWIKAAHPLSPPSTAKTIANSLRAKYRELAAAR